MCAKQVAPKTETITVRLDPKTKYGLELLSRKQYRNLSSVVEWAINRALNDEYEGIPDLEKVWDVYEPDRLVKLAINKPALLSYSEQMVWKVISETGTFWRGHYSNRKWTWTISENSAVWENIRKSWDTVKLVASGILDESDLPQVKDQPMKVDEFEDEIPF